MLEPLTIEDVLLVYLKQIVDCQDASHYGEYNFKQSLEQAKALNSQINDMIKFQQEIEQHRT